MNDAVELQQEDQTQTILLINYLDGILKISVGRAPTIVGSDFSVFQTTESALSGRRRKVFQRSNFRLTEL
jgi:hypothetical protein